MAKLSRELEETIWTLKRQLLDIINSSTEAEFRLFDILGETSDTIPFLDELKSVTERATPWFSRLSNSQVRIAESQPDISPDMLRFVEQSIERIEAEIPAMIRSIQEVKMEWNLP